MLRRPFARACRAGLATLLCWAGPLPGWSAAPGGSIAAEGVQAGQTPAVQRPVLSPEPGNPVVVMSTTLGDITIELFKDKAPVSVENFLQYVREGFYPGTVFHRVKPGFMIQGGGFTMSARAGGGTVLEEKDTRPPIQNEATNGVRNTRGTVAMARRQALRSATSQFYVNLVDNRMLDHSGFSPEDFGYAVFGRVLEGMDVVDRIAAGKTTTVGEMADVPVQPVQITSIVLRP